MASELAVKIVRLFLAVLSAAGWIIFVIGFGEIYHHLEKKMGKDGSDGGNAPFHKLYKIALSPMWLFGAAALPTFISMIAHTLVENNNWRHALHSCLMFFNFFYLASGGTTVFSSMAFIGIRNSKDISQLVPFSPRHLYLMLSGALLSIFFYWIETTIWPLFNIRRQRYPEYQELLDASASIPPIPHQTHYQTCTYHHPPSENTTK